MKKNLLFGLLILFVISTTAFAGGSDPKKDSEKSAVITKELKLSNEEISRVTKHAEIDNLGASNLLNKESSNSSKNLKATNQVYVETRHHRGGYGWYGGGGLLLVIVLVIILV